MTCFSSNQALPSSSVLTGGWITTWSRSQEASTRSSCQGPYFTMFHPSRCGRYALIDSHFKVDRSERGMSQLCNPATCHVYLPYLLSFTFSIIPYHPNMPCRVLPQIHRWRVIRGTGASHQHGDLVEHGTYKVATTKTYEDPFWISTILKAYQAYQPIRLPVSGYAWNTIEKDSEPQSQSQMMPDDNR